MKSTPEQKAVFKWALKAPPDACLNLIARAGSGKSTTLLELARRLSAKDPKTTIYIGAYNKPIADEMSAKLKRSGAPSTVTASTLHSAGLAAVRESYPDAEVLNYGKTEELFKVIEPHKWTFLRYKGEVATLVSLAKHHLFTPDTGADAWRELAEDFGISNPNEVVYYAQKVLEQDLDNIQTPSGDPTPIDFDDMIYLPVVLDLPVLQRDWVMIDEAQDLNRARQSLALKLRKPKGHLIACGDPAQAIYGFTGADSESMSTLARELNSEELPLSVSFRCPKQMIALAQQFVPDIRALPDAPEGTYETGLTLPDFLKLAGDLNGDHCVLCRNNAPIASLAYNLLAQGVSCRIEGRDIGRRLLTLSRKWKVPSITELEERLISYEKRETSRLVARGKLAQADNLHDTIRTLLIFCDRLRAEGNNDVHDLREYIASLFSDSNGARPNVLTLSTIHKAKGKEWRHIYYLGREALQPASWAERPREVTQEQNLIYVAYTRAMETLTEVTLG